jgi:hypothetical protein
LLDNVAAQEEKEPLNESFLIQNKLHPRRKIFTWQAITNVPYFLYPAPNEVVESYWENNCFQRILFFSLHASFNCKTHSETLSSIADDKYFTLIDLY